MSSSKTEKTKEEDDLVASISKSMTIPQLKKEIILADLWFGSKTKAKTKAEFVDMYISNGLHKTAEPSSSKAENKATSLEEKKEAQVVAKAESSARKAPASPPTTPPGSVSKVKNPSPSASVSKEVRVEPKKELILTLMINAHGVEGVQWPPTMPLAQYYKNNVRVYSRPCVPGIVGIGNPGDERKSIDDASTVFQNNPGKSTQEVMSEYTGLDRKYYKNFLDRFPRVCYDDALKNKERCGGLITYLSQKLFVFEDENLTALNSRRPYYKTDFEWNQFLESRGVNVSDIRLKITASDGSVTYRNIFNPYEEMSQIYHSNKERKEPIDIITKFNLIYRHGIEFILKDVLHREKLIGPALEIFKFKEGENRISSLNLDQLYEFFKLVGIKYINIIDHSCRSFLSSLKVTEEKAEELYKEEQKYIVKPVAFGKRSDSKRTKGKRSRRQIGSKRRQMSHRSRKHGIK